MSKRFYFLVYCCVDFISVMDSISNPSFGGISAVSSTDSSRFHGLSIRNNLSTIFRVCRVGRSQLNLLGSLNRFLKDGLSLEDEVGQINALDWKFEQRKLNRCLKEINETLLIIEGFCKELSRQFGIVLHEPNVVENVDDLD